jgi:hypothetical protein
MTLSAFSHSRGHPVPGANRTLKPYDVESTIGNFLGKLKIFGIIAYFPRKVALFSCHSEDEKMVHSVHCYKSPNIHGYIRVVTLTIKDKKNQPESPFSLLCTNF